MKVKGFRPHVRSVTLKGLLRCAQTTHSLTPALCLRGEFLLADVPKETKRTFARDLAGLRPDTALLSRNEMVSLKLTPLRFAQTGEPKAFRSVLRDSGERQGLWKIKN